MMKVKKRLFSLLLIGAFMFSLFGFWEFNSVKTLEVSATCGAIDAQALAKEGPRVFEESVPIVSTVADEAAYVSEVAVASEQGQTTNLVGESVAIVAVSEIESKGTDIKMESTEADKSAENSELGFAGIERDDTAVKSQGETVTIKQNQEVESKEGGVTQASEALGTVELSGSKFTADADKVPARGDTKVVAQFWTTEAKDKAPLEIGIGTGVAKTVEPQAPKATLEVQTTNLAERSASISLPQAAEAQALNLATGSTSISLHQGANEVTANEGKLPKVYNRAAIGDLRNYGSQKFSNFTTHDDDYLSDEGTASKNNIVSQAAQSLLVRSTTEQNYVPNLLGQKLKLRAHRKSQHLIEHQETEVLKDLTIG